MQSNPVSRQHNLRFPEFWSNPGSKNILPDPNNRKSPQANSCQIQKAQEMTSKRKTAMCSVKVWNRPQCNLPNLSREIVRITGTKLHLNGTVPGPLEIVSRPRVMEILGNICFSEQIFYRKQTMGAPEQ